MLTSTIIVCLIRCSLTKEGCIGGCQNRVEEARQGEPQGGPATARGKAPFRGGGEASRKGGRRAEAARRARQGRRARARYDRVAANLAEERLAADDAAKVVVLASDAAD